MKVTKIDCREAKVASWSDDEMNEDATKECDAKKGRRSDAAIAFG